MRQAKRTHLCIMLIFLKIYGIYGCRSLALSLAGVAVALNAGNNNANAAARRPPPPPPTEKKDPNVSGVLAKVLASKRRKEAMKESIAKLREKGKPVKEVPSE